MGGYWGYGAPVYAPSPVPPPTYSQPLTPENQVNMLKQEKQYLESEMNNIKSALDDISKRIADLEKSE